MCQQIFPALAELPESLARSVWLDQILYISCKELRLYLLHGTHHADCATDTYGLLYCCVSWFHGTWPALAALETPAQHA